MKKLRQLYKETLELYFPKTTLAQVGYELETCSRTEIATLYDGDRIIKNCSYRDMLQYLRIKTPSLPWVK